MRAFVLADLAINTTGYRLLVLAHLLCVVVGFGSSFVYPFMGAESSKRRGIEAAALSDVALIAAKRVTTPVIYAAGAIGLITAIIGPWDLGDAWIAIGVVVFAGAVLFAGFVHVPNLLRMNALTHELAAMGPPPEGAAAGPPPQAIEIEARGKRAALNGGILHLAFLVLMIDMIWKPGA